MIVDLSMPAAPVLDVISRMHELNGALSKREQRVANYVLENLEAVAHQSQSEIARAAEVSDATVTRFCQSLGCNGFRDFRVRFAQSLAVSLQYLRASQIGAEAEISDDELIDHVLGAAINLLTVARGQLRTEVLREAIDVLSGAGRIVFIGVGGNSSNLAAEGANRFFRLGIPSESHSDGYFQRMLASTLGEGDVLFAVSSSGSPGELLDSVAIAGQYRAKTVSLTRSGSPLAAATDVAIELELPEDRDIYKPTASRLAYLLALDIVATGVARANPASTREKLRRIRTSLVQIDQKTDSSPIGD